MGYIYKITNKINQKVYIGKTVKSPEFRWLQHKQMINHKQRYKKPLVLAFKKHGVENFIFEIIGQFEDEILSEKEIYYIKLYDSYGNSGYNATYGGEGCSRIKSIEYNEKIIKEYNDCQSVEEVAEKLELDISYVRRSLADNNIPIIRRKLIIKNPGTYNTRVSCYSLNNEYIATFPSIISAAKSIGKDRNASPSIGKCCRNKRKYAYGYKWQYA